ncbi:hypothetical protein [Streptomyces acidicola]|uniref:Uncharacterized protein n=1 Tax=Streptomyces acidicola TaxID=2596892 RepID=A0A5N8WWZ0_9ACTN|nr:hypothetical protein [Streptomyces acidicola]MPY51817.1 hypothetical protein [Streptomyces acidicola]
MIIAGYVGSNDFWNTSIGAVVGIAVGALGCWAALRSNNPKKRIAWDERSNQSLVPETSSGAPSPITITHSASASGPLTEARLIELKLRNAGRRDIVQGDFTLNDDSLIFDFGVPIEGVVDVTTKPDSAPRPDCAISGTELKIKRCPIQKGQELTYSVLVNGSEQAVKIKTAALLNTPVKREDKKARERRRLLTFGALNIVIAAAAAIYSFTQPTKSELKEHFQACRYWDVHDPARAKKECPEIKKP